MDQNQLMAAVKAILSDSDFTSAAVSIAVLDEKAIHNLNRRYLNHDWPTDVLSFVLENENGHLEGEVILSADTAARSAADIGWSATAEQLLYAIHGTLHLVGYGDKTAADRKEMRTAEAAYLKQFGLRQPPARPGQNLHNKTRTPPSRRRGATAR